MRLLQDLSKSFKNQALQGPRPSGQTADPWTLFGTFLKTLKIIDLGSFLESLWDPCGAPVGAHVGPRVPLEPLKASLVSTF